MKKELKKREKDELHKFVEQLIAKNRDDIRLIELFGSAARGELSEDSDMDILVVIKGGRLKLIKEIARIVSGLLLKYGRYISVKVFDEKQYEYLNDLETSFMKNIEKEGRILWKKS